MPFPHLFLRKIISHEGRGRVNFRISSLVEEISCEGIDAKIFASLAWENNKISEGRVVVTFLFGASPDVKIHHQLTRPTILAGAHSARIGGIAGIDVSETRSDLHFTRMTPG